MAEDKISSIIDFVSLQKEIDQFNALTKEMRTKLTGFPKVKVEVENSASAKEFSLANAKMQQEVKSIINLANQRYAADAKVITLQTDYAKATAASRLEIQKQNAELKVQAQLQAASTGSIEKAKASVKALSIERDKLNLFTKEGQAQQAKLNAEIDKYNVFITKSSSLQEKQSRNVGNYQGSAKIIVDALEKERLKLIELQAQRAKSQEGTINRGSAGNFSKSGNTVSSNSSSSLITSTSALDNQISETTKKIETLQQVVDKPQFLKLAGSAGDATKQLAFFRKALIDLETQGQGNSEAAKTLRKNLAELTDQIGDAKAEVKALSSDTRGFDLFAGSVKFAADSFQLFAGAAVLAGASEEDAAEATATLTAVQSVANGVKGIATELTTRGTAANKVFAFAQLQVKTAMDVTATSAARLRAALITIGIGALIIGIGLLIANFGKIKDALSGVSEAQKLNNEVGKKAVENYSEQVSKLSILIETVKKGGLSFDQKKKAVANYNEEFGKTLGSVKDYTELENRLIANGGKYIEYLEIKASAEAAYQLAIENKKKALEASIAGESKVGTGAKVLLAFRFGNVFDANGDYQKAVEGANKRITNNEINDAEGKANKLLKIQSTLLEKQEALKKTLNIKEDEKAETPKKSKSEKKANDDALKAAVESEKVKQAALLAVIIANANEKIRVAQNVINDENASLEDQNKAIKTIYNERLKIESLTTATSIASEKQVQNGKIVEVKKGNEVINKELNDFNIKFGILNEEAAQQRIDVAKKSTDRILKIEQDFAKDRMDLEEATNKIIDKIRKKQKEQEEKDDQDKLNRKIDIEKRIIDAKKELQKEAVESIKAFVNAGFERETQGLDERKRLLDEDTARRINQINLIGLTEVDRTRQIAIVQKDAAFQNEQIEKRKRQIAVERAKFEKAASVASIIAGTAQAIVAALGSKPFTPANLGLAALVGGIGLLQLTRAIATPIPKYKDGRGKGKDEMAIVGDGGKHEYIMRGNGLIEQTPRTDTLTRLMPNDVVFKDNNALLNAMLNASNPYAQILKIKPNNNDGFSRNDINKLIRAVEKERMPKISIHNSAPIESTAYYQHHIKN